MSRRTQWLLLDLGLLGAAAVIASVSVSLAVEPLIMSAPLAMTEWRAQAALSSDIASLDAAARDRLSALTGLPVDQGGIIAPPVESTAPLPYSVTGTVVGASRALAVLFDASSRTSLLVRTGDPVADAVVTGIERGRVIVMRREGHTEVLTRDTAISSDVPRTHSDTVRALGDDRVAVPRHMVDFAARNLASLGTQAFFSPTFHNGAMAFRIDRIKAGSLFEQLGLRNGDVLLSVDDVPFDRLDLLGARYAQLSHLREVRVAFSRGGQVQRRTYEIGG